MPTRCTFPRSGCLSTQNAWAASAHPTLPQPTQTEQIRATHDPVGWAFMPTRCAFPLSGCLLRRTRGQQVPTLPSITNTNRTNTRNARLRRVGIHTHAACNFRLSHHPRKNKKGSLKTRNPSFQAALFRAQTISAAATAQTSMHTRIPRARCCISAPFSARKIPRRPFPARP